MGLRYRGNIQGGCFFVTTSVVGHIKIFENANCAQIIIDSLNYCKRKFRRELKAYVIMPNHLHMVILLDENTKLCNFMRDLNKFTSVAIKKYLAENDESKIMKVLKPYIPAKPKLSFKLWQDRFDDVQIYSDSVLLTKLNYINQNPVKAGLVDSASDWPYLYLDYLEP